MFFQLNAFERAQKVLVEDMSVYSISDDEEASDSTEEI